VLVPEDEELRMEIHGALAEFWSCASKAKRPTESGLVTSVARVVQSWCKPLWGLDMRTPPTDWAGGVYLVAGAGFGLCALFVAPGLETWGAPR